MSSKRFTWAERERQLNALLAELRHEGIPTWPADFARRAGISKTYLASFSVYEEVSDYARHTAPEKMRGTFRSGGGKRNDKVLEIRSLKSKLAASEEARAMAQTTVGALRMESAQERAVLAERISRLERMVEALVSRAVEAGIDVRDVEEALTSASEMGFTNGPELL